MNSPISKLDGWFVGEDQTFEWTVYQDDDMTIQDITGWTMQWRVARAPNQPSVLTKPALLVDPGNGVCNVTVLPSDTAPLPPFVYYYQLWRLDPGFVDVVADGKAHLQARVA